MHGIMLNNKCTCTALCIVQVLVEWTDVG